MRIPLLAGLLLAMIVSGCGGFRESRFNPFNWFGQPEPAQAVALPMAAADPRPLAAQITDLTIDRMPGGAIIRATALPQTQGYWDADLVERKDAADPATLILEFRMRPPVGRADVSTPRSREVVAALFVSDIRLAEVGAITVQSATNGLTSRR
ncbi:MAG: hypothetical protein U5N10_05100 [Gemmobacter sp.]|nr:hypothetical protein [Gemmobacter sp.]